MKTKHDKALQQQAADLITAMLTRRIIPADISPLHPNTLILGSINTDGVSLKIDISPHAATLSLLTWYDAPPGANPAQLPHIKPIGLKLPLDISRRCACLHRSCLNSRRNSGYPIITPNPATARYLTAATTTFNTCYQSLKDYWNTPENHD